MKLYEVVLRGVDKYRTSYVVAESTDIAYDIVRKYLDEKDIGFESDRELETITLLAENTDYPACQTNLYIQTDVA